MKVTVALTMELSTPEGDQPTPEAASSAIADTEQAIQSRLMGAGFLPDDIEVDSYVILSTINDR